MKKIINVSIAILFVWGVTNAQVNLVCTAGGTVTFFYTGPSGVCVSTAPTKGFLRFNFGSNCNLTNQDPIFIQNACQCCPVFNNDCFKYTNTNPAGTTDVFVIGGVTYNVSIQATRINCPPGGSNTFFYSGPSGACVSTAPARGFLRFNFGSNCNLTNQDPIFIQNACQCCPIFNNDCFRYTNTNTSLNYDFFVIGANTYVVHLGGTLPVKLTGVKAYQKNNANHVEWTVQEESEMERYDVERSPDGMQFLGIGSVTPRNTCVSSCEYKFIDPVPLRGTNFYRVKLIDRSGEIKYSQVMKVIDGAGQSSITIAPNPIIGNMIMLQIQGLEKGVYTASLFNSSGQTIFTRLLQHNGGSASQTLEFPPNANTGIYRLVVEGEGVRFVNPVVRQ